jgi:hypothetical protein
MAKTQKEQRLYNKMLVTQAINYQNLGYTHIKINNQNYPHGQPTKVGEYTPDLSAVFENSTTICEVVTKDLMNEPKMIDRWRTFNRSGFAFHMMLQQTSLNEFKKFTKENGIVVTKYWYSKDC